MLAGPGGCEHATAPPLQGQLIGRRQGPPLLADGPAAQTELGPLTQGSFDAAAAAAAARRCSIGQNSELASGIQHK